MRYLLDTNILSDLVRNPQGRVYRKIREVGEAQICTSVIVASELQYGAAKKKSEPLNARVLALLSALEVMPLDSPVESAYARIRTELEAAGQSIGGNDLFIAAQALTLELTLVSDNVKEFRRVAGLSLENWLR